jgi:hypothetical protein
MWGIFLSIVLMRRIREQCRYQVALGHKMTELGMEVRSDGKQMGVEMAKLAMAKENEAA